MLGGAACVWNDAAAALDLFAPDLVVAANDIGARWVGLIDAWVTLHPEKMERWRAARERRGLPPAREHIGHFGRFEDPGIDRRIDHLWPGTTSGSSGLFAAKVALELGADRVVLAGVPLTVDGAHFFDPRPWTDRAGFVRGWQTALPHIKDRVRSLSGWTRELLGAPTPAWLAG